MKRNRFAEEQIIGILKEREAGSADLCRKHGVSDARVCLEYAPPKSVTNADSGKAERADGLIGTVRGTKLWAGDCVEPEIRGSTTTTETRALSERATAVIPPGQKE